MGGMIYSRLSHVVSYRARNIELGDRGGEVRWHSPAVCGSTAHLTVGQSRGILPLPAEEGKTDDAGLLSPENSSAGSYRDSDGR